MKLLRLDCAAGGQRGRKGGEKRQNGGVVPGERKTRQRERYKRADRRLGRRGGGGEGLELRAEQRGGITEPNLLRSGASTFHSIVLSPPPSHFQ